MGTVPKAKITGASIQSSVGERQHRSGFGVVKKAPLFLTPAAVGRMVGLSKKTIIKHIERGGITASRTFTGRYQISRKEFYRYQAAMKGIVI